MGPTGFSSLSKKTIMSEESPLEKRGDWAELMFAMGLLLGTRKKWPIADRCVPGSLSVS